MAAAIPVYTVSDESRYLIVKNVPALGCAEELVKLFGSYGPIEEYRIMDEEESEPFTDIYWIKFVKIANARFAKRKLDKFNFFGNLLQVTYAPTYETLSDTKEKLEERQNVLLSRIRSEKHGQVKHVGQTAYSVAVNQRPHPSLLSQNLPQHIGSFHATANTFDHNPQLENQRASLGDPKDFIQQQTKVIALDTLIGLPMTNEEVTRSMDATVHAVRQKLNQISSMGLQPTSMHAGSATRLSEVEQPPVEKKARVDNRRRI